MGPRPHPHLDHSSFDPKASSTEELVQLCRYSCIPSATSSRHPDSYDQRVVVSFPSKLAQYMTPSFSIYTVPTITCVQISKIYNAASCSVPFRPLRVSFPSQIAKHIITPSFSNIPFVPTIAEVSRCLRITYYFFNYQCFNWPYYAFNPCILYHSQTYPTLLPRRLSPITWAVPL